MSKRTITIKPEWWDAEIEAAVAAGPILVWEDWEEDMLARLDGRVTRAALTRHLNRKRAERGLPGRRTQEAVQKKLERMKRA